ncbi:MAG: Ig-like domain-containing protein [Polyangiaceae bacterium]
MASASPSRLIAQRVGLLCALGAALLSAPVRAQGVPNLTYQPSEVGTVLARIDSSIGAPRGHGNVMIHRGYLTVIFSRDSGKGDGGFAFFDISDPRTPTLVFAKDDDETEDIREAHGYGVVRFEGRDLFFMQASFGLQVWDFTDVTAPFRVNYLKLPGITDSDYGTGAWFVFPQWPYLYLGGSSNGLYVVDIHDPSAPFLVDRAGLPNPIPPTLLGDFKTGPVYAAGNLLTITGMDQPGYSTLDISRPEQPLLLTTRRDGLDSIYSGLFNGGFLYGAGTQSHVTVHDVRDPLKILDYSRSPEVAGRGGYLSVQDGKAHCGESQHFVVVDFNDPKDPRILLEATSGVDGRDEDFATTLGNLTIVSDDHGNGSFIIPHDTAPDTTPPRVNFLSPPNGAVGQALDLRVGMTFSDAIDFQSVDESTVKLRVAGGAAVPGYFSYQAGVLNFGPKAPLTPNTTYEVEVPAGGVRDVAGNPIAEPLVAVFSTGQLVENPGCKLTSSGPTELGKDTELTLEASGDAFAWDFGDGAGASTPSAGKSTTHRFAAPGHYSVIAYAYSAGALATTCTLTQTVHRPVLGRAPKSSSILLDPARERVWSVNKDQGTLSVLDAQQNTLLKELAVASEPRAVALGAGADGSKSEVWVVSDEGRSLQVFDADTLESVAQLKFPWGSRPSGVLLPEGGPGYVTLRGTGKVVSIDRATHRPLAEVALPPEPFGLALDPEGQRLFVSHFLSPETHGLLSVIQLPDFALSVPLELAEDPGPDTESSSRGVPNYLRALSLSPDRSDLWLVGKKDNTSRGWWRDGEALTHESTVRSVALRIDASTLVEDVARRLDLDDRNLPSAVELSPLGDIAFVATEGSNTIEVLDAYSGRRISSIDHATKAPEGLWLDERTARLYVQGFMSRSIAVYDVSLLISSGSNRAELISEIPTTTREVLAPDVLAGKRIFYDSSDIRMSRDNYLSCATCHLDGEQDGRVWDFTNRGEGLRNTTTLRGKQGGQGRLHWSGNFDEVQDFEHDIRSAFGGLGFMNDADFHAGRDTPLGEKKAGASKELDQLSAYLESLEKVPDSPFRTEHGEMSARAKQGQRVFERLECATCHSGEAFTNSSDDTLYNVGTLSAASGQRLGDTLTGIDTPTLLGLWATAPYLHDGSAKTLDDVLERAAKSGKHGDIQSLSSAEREALVQYLLELDQSEAEPHAEVTPEDSGCACHITSRNRSGWGVSLAGLLLGLLLGRRRRSARRR